MQFFRPCAAIASSTRVDPNECIGSACAQSAPENVKCRKKKKRIFIRNRHVCIMGVGGVSTG